MKARALLDGAALGPDAIKVIEQAFDEVWADIGANYRSDVIGESPAAASQCSTFDHKDNDDLDVASIKKAAIEAMGRGD